MQNTSLTENILLGVIALGAVFWLSPGIKSALAKSRPAEGDWLAALWPLAAVVLFVFFLIAVVRS